MDDVLLVTVLYSQAYDLYRLPSTDKTFWLSTTVYPLPLSERRTNTVYLGALTTADENGWRRAYALDWPVVMPGDVVAIPADDPLVLDYEAATLEEAP